MKNKVTYINTLQQISFCHRCVSIAQTLEEEEGALVDLTSGAVAECQAKCVQEFDPTCR